LVDFFVANVDDNRPQLNGRTFATLQILLPARITGGRVEITYGTATSHYDIHQNSETVTAIAWYLDAECKAEPIISGYQLALSYEIIHALPTPVPHLSFMLDNLANLRRLLGYWALEDTSHSIPRMLAFVLKSNYREDESWFATLTRSDMHKLEPVAGLLGFKLFTAVLDCHLSGDADDQNDSFLEKSGRTRWSRPYPSTPKLPTMGTLRSKKFEAKEFADSDGDFYAHMAGWLLNESDITLQTPLQVCVPDAIEYEGFIHNVSFIKPRASIYCHLPLRFFSETRVPPVL